MGKKISTPLLFQSKLLCFSLFYLCSSLFLALYTSLSSSECLFRSSPFDPIQTPLFFYPSSYGEHKYALPTLRSSCNSPVFFADYSRVLMEIQQFCENFTVSDSELMYLHRNADSFGGNFSTQKRVSFFDHTNESFDVPCGFLKDFPISDSDRFLMESCNGVVVVSAIFNDHDKIRQPKGLGSKTLENVCFFMFIDDITLKGLNKHKLIAKNSLESKIGVWKIVRVWDEKLYESPAMNGVIPKYLVHRLFPNSKFSVWVDAKLQLVVDPLLLIHSLVLSEDVDMAISKHPCYVQTMEEAMATARWKKWWNVDSLKIQIETYCDNGLLPWSPKKLPYTSDVPDSALILRKHGLRSNLFSCLMFNELEAFNPRDQLPFAYVRDKMVPKMKVNMFEVEVFQQIAVEYRHNLKKEGTSPKVVGHKTEMASSDLYANATSSGNKCHNYLLEMWGDSHY